MGWLDDAEAQLDADSMVTKALADAEDWKPEAGETLMGTLVEGRNIKTKYGPTYIMAVKTSDDEILNVWCGSKMLRNALLLAMPAVGSGVIIKYEGKTEGKKNNWHQYYMNAEPHGDAAAFEKWAAFWTHLERVTAAGITETKTVTPIDSSFNGSSEQGDLTAPF